MKSYFVYVGTKKCGCAVAACVDEPKFAQDTANSIARLVKNGLTVNRVEIDEQHPVPIESCECEKLKKGQI